jgi:UPF0755 protein
MQNSKRRGRLGWKIIPVVMLIIFLIGLSGAFTAWRMYEQNLEPVSTSEQTQSFTVASGASVQDIAISLQDAELIRSAWAFEWYVRKEGARQFLKAGTYNLRPNQSVPEIVEILTQGKVTTGLVTILPGQRLDQIKDTLINRYDFEQSAVEAALNPNTYAGHPVLADKPAGASLEGFLYPESFQKTANTTPQNVIRASLDQMYKHLTLDLKNGIVQQGLTVYQGITLASLVENEVSNVEDRKQVAQVFLRRLREDRFLESDTSSYTYSNKGLPPEPISNVTTSSLEAVANPAPTDFLYFVSGDDGRTHFSHTQDEHEALTEQFCTRLCQ